MTRFRSVPVNEAPDSILVVDDSNAMRTLHARLLERAGFRVVLAANAAEALDHVAVDNPSLVLLDYMMPQMDGPEFLRRMREREAPRRTPVIFLTASSSREHMDVGFDSGADDYISKPVDARVLVARVKSTLAAARERALTERTKRVVKQRDHLEGELVEAREVQRSQLPSTPIRAGEYDVDGAVVPSGQLGGDVFDIVDGEDGSLIAFVIDVSGHGLAAALVAASARSVLRLLLRAHPMKDAIAMLNQHLCEAPGEHYACVAIVRLVGRKLTVINAGLPPVAVVEGEQVVARISGAGTPPGLFPDADYDEITCSLSPFSRVVMMSDGLTEPFGHADEVDRTIAELVLAATTDVPAPLSERIETMLKSGTESDADDATLVSIGCDASVRRRRLDGSIESIDEAIDWLETDAPSWVDHGRLELGLTEALSNAVVHGVLGVESAVRQGSLTDYLDATVARSANRNVDDAVSLAIERGPDVCTVWIRWTGKACPPEHRAPKPMVDPLALSGRGMAIVYACFDDVGWSDDGRGMTLTLRRVAA